MTDVMSNGADKQSEHLFLDKFPPEITTAIFSFLKQDDCLTCMDVCRQWYTIVPQCSRSLWKDLHIFNFNTHANDTRWRLCLGEHVQTVKFYTFQDETSLYNEMQQLIDAGCNHIKSLAFYESCSSRIWDFYSLLGQLAKSTTELIFRQHSDGLALNHLLSLCPKLTYLYIKDYEYLSLQDDSFDADSQAEFTSLTHLFFDVTEKHITQKLLPTLKRCPNLQYLGYRYVYSSIDERALLPNATAIDLDDIFSLCPKLVYLETNSEEFLNRGNTLNQISNNNDTPGLRILTVRETEHNDVDKIGKYLGKNAETLEYLSIHGDGNDWTSVFRNLRLPRLRFLICSNITYRDCAMDLLLSQSFLLEELRCIICFGRADSNIVRMLQSLTSLRHLELNGVTLCYESVPTNATVGIDQSASKLALQDIQLTNSYPVKDELLQVFTRSSALKSVALYFPPESDVQYVGDMLCRFIERLYGSKIDSLFFSGLTNPPAAMIRAIGGLKTLWRIVLYSPYQVMRIDGTALLHMLRNKNLGSANISGLKLIGGMDDDAVFEQIEAGFEMTKVNNQEYGTCDLYLKTK